MIIISCVCGIHLIMYVMERVLWRLGIRYIPRHLLTSFHCLLTKEILVGSPPHSSKMTRRFPVGFSHEIGTWYLWMNWQRLHYYQSRKKRKIKCSETWEELELVELKLTISARTGHSYSGISSQWKSQHNCMGCNCLRLYMRASAAQCSAHLSILDPCPCSTCPRLLGYFLQVHWMLPAKSNHIPWLSGTFCREFP